MKTPFIHNILHAVALIFALSAHAPASPARVPALILHQSPSRGSDLEVTESLKEVRVDSGRRMSGTPRLLQGSPNNDSGRSSAIVGAASSVGLTIETTSALSTPTSLLKETKDSATSPMRLRQTPVEVKSVGEDYVAKWKQLDNIFALIMCAKQPFEKMTPDELLMVAKLRDKLVGFFKMHQALTTQHEKKARELTEQFGLKEILAKRRSSNTTPVTPVQEVSTTVKRKRTTTVTITEPAGNKQETKTAKRQPISVLVQDAVHTAAFYMRDSLINTIYSLNYSPYEERTSSPAVSFFSNAALPFHELFYMLDNNGE